MRTGAWGTQVVLYHCKAWSGMDCDLEIIHHRGSLCNSEATPAEIPSNCGKALLLMSLGIGS